ncbi:O-antigen ligase [Demequina sp. NBRC 110053]|uniref:O-antigen ligase family protein n=1 Tax=Demequina sp. NBRC 110053 TaxID=1570342 RepID=UPI000A055377|nr:O-antigen ligase family protein [Demequina sp. NBRC 110053]
MAVMLGRARDRAWANTIAVAAGAVAIAASLAVLAVDHSSLVLPIAVGLLLIGVASVDMTLVPIVAFPATLATLRVGGFVSLSDVVLGAATVIALFMLQRRGAMVMQPLILAGVAYLALMIPTLVWRPYSENLVEWAHELVLVLGSMAVGFVVGRNGRASAALGAYVLACCVVGVIAVLTTVNWFIATGALAPAYVGDLHKNTVGGMLASALIIAYARPPWLGWSRGRVGLAMAVLAAGIAASQSRQGMIAALVGMLIIATRPYVGGMRRPKLIWLVALAVAVLVAINVSSQLSSGNPFNSATERVRWYEEGLAVWRESPIVGNGLRWWYTPEFAGHIQPPNAELEVLTSGGVVGLVGFLAMFAIASWALLRLPAAYGTLGLAVVAGRFTQGQFDLYWVAGQAALLWLVAALCYGVYAKHLAEGTVIEDESPRTLDLRAAVFRR